MTAKRRAPRGHRADASRVPSVGTRSGRHAGPRGKARRSPSLVHSGVDTARGVRADSGIAVDVACDGTRCPVAGERVREIVRRTLRHAGVKNAMVSVTFLPKRAMTRMNREHLGRSGPTDVISFGFGATGPNRAVVGDIYICPDVARANAKEFGSGVREELVRLVVHGTLHVLGRTHPEGLRRVKSDMWAEQELLVRDVG